VAKADKYVPRALIATIGLDRQLSHPISLTTKQNIEAAFARALENTALTHPEVSFARDALAEYWAQRIPQMKPESEPAMSGRSFWSTGVAEVRDPTVQTPVIRDQRL
jgi:hypothetical protein